MKGLCVVPAFNEGEVIEEVLARVPAHISDHKLDTLVINDGSTDQTEQVLKKMKVKYLNHLVNRGLGAALGTGFEYARRRNYDFLITLDADGQHDPREIARLIKPLINKQADFVIGTRFLRSGMPLTRQVITFFASLITYFFIGIWTSDSQSGFRVFSKRAIQLIFVDVDRMEVSSDFFNQVKKNHLKMVEVPITPIYTEYSLKKGQNIFNSVNIIVKLALKNVLR